MADNDEIGNFGTLADFVGNQAHVQESLMFDRPIAASLGKIFQDNFAALLQDFTHLRGKVEVRFESERARKYRGKKCSIEMAGRDVLPKECAANFFRHPYAAIERGCECSNRREESKYF